MSNGKKLTGLKKYLDDILPFDTPEKVKEDMMEYARENPDKSDAEIAEDYRATLTRSLRKTSAAQEETVKNTPKNVPTKRMKNRKKELQSMTGKTAMMRGGMAGGKQHMYVAGGSVTDKMNPGLRALNATRPDVVKKILKS